VKSGTKAIVWNQSQENINPGKPVALPGRQETPRYGAPGQEKGPGGDSPLNNLIGTAAKSKALRKGLSNRIVPESSEAEENG